MKTIGKAIVGMACLGALALSPLLVGESWGASAASNVVKADCPKHLGTGASITNCEPLGEALQDQSAALLAACYRKCTEKKLGYSCRTSCEYYFTNY